MSGHKIIDGLQDAMKGNFSRVEMGAQVWLRFAHGARHAANSGAWAIGFIDRGRFRVRRIVWGRAMARAEKRDGEHIRRATIIVDCSARAR